MLIQTMIDFPEARQSTNFSCGASSVQALLYYYGIEYREDELIKKMDVLPTHIESSGVRPATVVSFLRKNGLAAYMQENMTIEQLKQFSDSGTPVLIAMQAWNEKKRFMPDDGLYATSYEDGHYVVVIGYGMTKDGTPAILIEDPSIMSHKGWLSEQELLSRWHDKDSAGRVYIRLGIPVTRGSTSNKLFNRKIIKKIH